MAKRIKNVININAENKGLGEGSYWICNGCLKAIRRNGILAHKKAGRGYSKHGISYHKGCLKKLIK
jgi:hypothetical protein